MTSRDGPGPDQQSAPAANRADAPRGPADLADAPRRAADLLDQLRHRLDRLPANHPSALPPEAGETRSEHVAAGGGPAARLRDAGAAAERHSARVPDSDPVRAGEWALPGMAGEADAAGWDAAAGKQGGAAGRPDVAAGRPDAIAGAEPDGPGASAAALGAAGSRQLAGDTPAAWAAPWPAAWGYSVEPYRPWFTAGDAPGPWFAVQARPADPPGPDA